MRKMALTVPGEAMALTGKLRHRGNCSSTNWRTVSGDTLSWLACMRIPQGLRTSICGCNVFAPPGSSRTGRGIARGESLSS